MSPFVTSRVHLEARRTIAAHFAGRATLAAEAAMRAHLGTCSDCRIYYERHWLLAQLDPKAIDAQKRLAIGLGFSRRHESVRARAVLMTATTAIVAALIWWPSYEATRAPHPSATADTVTARGARPSAARAQAFWTYRVANKPAPVLAGETISAHDELAFAYSNPAAKAYLMVFARDEQAHVYWFYPDWTPGEAGHVSVPAVLGPGPHELPEAIAHDFLGKHLTVFALFSDQRLDAANVESKLSGLDADAEIPELPAGSLVVRRTFEVRP